MHMGTDAAVEAPPPAAGSVELAAGAAVAAAEDQMHKEKCT